MRNYFIIVVAFPFILPTTFFGLQKKREEEEKKLSPYWAPWPLFVDWRFTLPKKLSVDRLKFQGRHCALGAPKNGSALYEVYGSKGYKRFTFVIKTNQN